MKKETLTFNAIFYPILIGLTIWSVVKNRNRNTEYKELVLSAYCMGWNDGLQGCCDMISNNLDTATYDDWSSLYEEYFERDSIIISDKLFKK